MPGTVTLTGSSDIWSCAHSSFEFLLKQNWPTNNSQHLHVAPYLLRTISAHKNVSCVRKQYDSKARTRGLFLESPDNWRARKAAIDYIQDRAFNSCSNNMIKQPVNITELNDLSARIHTFSSLDCVVPKNIPYLPDGGHFCFRLPTTLEFPFQGVLGIPSQLLDFPLYSNLDGYFLERIFPSKMSLHHTFMQKIIVSAIKRGKYFIYVNTVSNNLNFAL